MNMPELVETFKCWLNERTPDHIYCTTDFINHKIGEFLFSEADGDTIFENDEIIVGSYNYEYELQPENSVDGNSHHFAFQAFGVGTKENVTENDYELADYTESSFIIKHT